MSEQNEAILPIPEPTGPRTQFAAKLREVPHKSGVYIMRDRLNRVIYVGKAVDLRRRLSSYFLPSRARKADIKTRALIESVWDFEWHVVRSEAEALLLEGRLIKDYRPKYNVSFRDDKRFLLVRVNLNDPFPRFSLTRLRKDDGARYFGPFAHGGALRAALAEIKKRFGLRSCLPTIPTERDYKHCLDHIIKNCSAPCVGKITPEEYRRRVEEACAFLDGQSREMLNHIEKEMLAAAQSLDFEKAARLRDLLADLITTTEPATRFTRKALPTTIDPARDLEELRDVLGLERAPTIMECFDISNITSTHIVASMVRFKNGVPERNAYRRYRIKGVKGQDDFASMAEVVRRRYSRVLMEGRRKAPDVAEFSQESPLEAMRRIEKSANASATESAAVRLPDLIIVDGGRGQLSSACRELQRLGLSELPIIGLAKEFEEIYRPDSPVPLRLPETSGALRMLQRIRDEAHRFANSFHSLLLKKRMTESLLDDVPGMTPRKKKLLLLHFGSVAAIKSKSVEQLAALPGISKKLAEAIHDHFRRRNAADAPPESSMQS